MVFPYRSYAIEPIYGHPETIIYRPVIPVTLSGGKSGQAKIIYGLLDTGADQTLVNEEIAELLGLKLSHDTLYRMLTPNGALEIPSARIKIALHKPPHHYTWTAVVGVIPQRWPQALLGQQGFLQFFDATFQWDKRQVKVTRNRTPVPPTK